MKTLLKIIGFIWLLPVTILFWTFYVLPLIIAKDIKFRYWVGPVAVFELVSRKSWYARKWRNWLGFSGPCFIIFHDLTVDEFFMNPVWKEVLRLELKDTITHELRHCDQQLVFGSFFYPFYILISAAIWIYATVLDKDLHAYYDNPYEVDARRHTGQPIKIPRSSWPSGKLDRNPWM